MSKNTKEKESAGAVIKFERPGGNETWYGSIRFRELTTEKLGERLQIELDNHEKYLRHPRELKTGEVFVVWARGAEEAIFKPGLRGRTDDQVREEENKLQTVLHLMKLRQFKDYLRAEFTIVAPPTTPVGTLA